MFISERIHRSNWLETINHTNLIYNIKEHGYPWNQAYDIMDLVNRWQGKKRRHLPDMSDWDTKKTAQNRWNRIHASYEKKDLAYDGWLDSFRQVIIDCQTPVIDLGCGSGNDTLYLVELGKEVIPCDYSENAIKNIRKNFPEVQRAECFDVTEGLPFPDDFTDIILADLSLHYFHEKTTLRVLDDLRRVLKPAGLLLFRVNSIHDINYGAGQGIEVERHFYQTDTMGYKRFFDESDIRRFFHGWELIHAEESVLDRYEKPKILWTAAARNPA